MKTNMDARRKWLGIAALLALTVLFVALAVFLGRPILSLFRDPAVFRNWVEEKGWGARFSFVGMMAVQTLIALIPGEPLEIAAGFSFGTLEGTVLVLAGCAIGSTLVFLLVRALGIRLVNFFFSMEKIRSMRFFKDSRKVYIVFFILMTIPGTPKDLISYFVPLTDIKLGKWVILSTFARIPSVITSTVGGDALGDRNYLFAVIVFGITMAVSLAGLWIYEHILKKRGKEGENHAGN